MLHGANGNFHTTSMRRLTFILPLQAWAILLAFVQTLGGGVRTDEAKYLLNIPYPQPPLARWILGWTEALPLMKEGAKWMLYIPAKLAYGERGAGYTKSTSRPLS